jgi:hypothetical protein
VNQISIYDNRFMHKTAAYLGLSSVIIFGVTLVIISSLTPEFHFLENYVSELGAQGQPYALWWNLIGFLLVGTLLTAFGYFFGRVVDDRWVGICLALFGVGFATTAIPIELGSSESALSTAHVIAICLGLAGWMFGLARMAHIKTIDRSVRFTANIAATLVVLPIFGFVAGLWSMPVTHRLVFVVVFGWVAFESIRLFMSSNHTNDQRGIAD